LHNRKLALFQGQIETALKKFRADLERRMRSVFSVLHIQSHLTGAGIRKAEGHPPLHLLFVMVHMMFLPIQTVHALMQKPWAHFFLAHKDACYRETIGDIFRQLEEETGKLTFMERLQQHFSTFLQTALDTLADFCHPDPNFRSYLDIITNAFNHFFHMQGCET